MTRRVCEYHWERTFRQTLCLRALAANVCSSSSCLESDLSCKIGQTMGFSAKLCVSKWRSFVSCHKKILTILEALLKGQEQQGKDIQSLQAGQGQTNTQLSHIQTAL